MDYGDVKAIFAPLYRDLDHHSLHELEGAAPARIARLLGLRPATVRWHLSVGRKELARLLLARPEE